MPQPPQLLGSVVKSAHSMPASPSQYATVRELGQHVPRAQLMPARGQGLPQRPQLSGSIAGSVQIVPPSPSEHVVRLQVQAPPRQLSPAGQTRPHPPQLSLSSRTCEQISPPSELGHSV